MLRFRVRDLPDSKEHIFNVYLEYFLNGVCDSPFTIHSQKDYVKLEQAYALELDPADQFLITLKDFPQELKSYIIFDN